ncbi:MAG: DUF3854 domain-containing protein [Anaerolineaceae bacterium]|nr:DUF3854 domain-containing protein [Anaerolineaceae bacterium]
MTSPITQLSEHHLNMLKAESGISDQVIDARGYRTVTEEGELVEYGFSPRQRRVPGLLLPLHTTDGNIGLHVYRPDNPRTRENRKKRDADGMHPVKVTKYEIPQKGEVRIDCPPVCRKDIGNPNIPLYITEGQKKADALASHGACVIDLLGVWNFKGKNDFDGVTVLVDFDYIAWKERSIRIVFDSDVMYIPHVRKAMERLTEILQRKGARVSSIYLPHQADGHKWGIDDWLAAGHTMEELENLAEQPRPLPKPANPIIELLDEPTPTITRPLCLIDNYAYAAAWIPLKITRKQSLDEKGHVVELPEPQVEEKLVLHILRNDGQIFGEFQDGHIKSYEKLGVNINLPEIIPLEKRWTTKGIQKFLFGHHPNPLQTFLKITEIVDTFLDFENSLADQQSMCELLACYIMATYLLDAFTVIGYLWANGIAGSGKTNLLIIVSMLAYLGQLIQAGGSFASLRDLSDYGATLAFDDSENISDPKLTNPDKRTLLLAGNRKGPAVSLKEPDGQRSWKTRYVNAFCPRLFSAISIPEPVLSSRSIIIPLIRTTNREKANYDPHNNAKWPHDRKSVQDDLWAIGLLYLPHLHQYQEYVAENARLKGRPLEPWIAILTIAAWLDAMDVKRIFLRGTIGENGKTQFSGLYGRLEEISWRYQQKVSEEIQTGDLTYLVMSGVCQLISESSDICDTCDGSDIINHKWQILTKKITEAVQSYAKIKEADIDIHTINPYRVGKILGQLRLEQARESGTGNRQWVITIFNIHRWINSYGIHVPDRLASLLSVTNVTDVLMSQSKESWKEGCEILLCLPEDSTLPTIGGFWQRRSDGKIEAGYSVEQLVMALSIYLDKEIELEKIKSMPAEQFKNRIIEVTQAEVLHLNMKEEIKIKRTIV